MNTTDDCPTDLCAYGKVQFSIDELEIVVPTEEWTLSAATIYLLRTLERDHTFENMAGGPLFPCCGFSMYDTEDSEDVLIVGCPNGIDASVLHENGAVKVTVQTGESKLISETVWKEAVLNFSTEIRRFYDSCAEKIPHDDVARKGYDKMLHEWQRRHPRKTNA